MKIRRKKTKQTIFVLFFNVYTAVSVWEYDCSGMVIRVLAPAALVSEVTWTDAWLLPATENRLPLKEACFCKTRWMLGLLEACCSCWLSIPWRKAFTTRICKIKTKNFSKVKLFNKIQISRHRFGPQSRWHSQKTWRNNSWWLPVEYKSLWLRGNH